MLLEDADHFLELAVAERCTIVHGLGDTRFRVRVRISCMFSVFTAESLIWVAFPSLVAFAKQLNQLEVSMQGAAVLESMSPEELRLEVKSTDRVGHVAAVGQVGQWFGVGSGDRYLSAVAFRIPFCPIHLPDLVREFAALALAPEAEPRQ